MTLCIAGPLIIALCLVDQKRLAYVSTAAIGVNVYLIVVVLAAAVLKST